MNDDDFTTPVNSRQRFTPSVLRTHAGKRDSLAAELERDPQLSSSKRQQRSQAFTSTMVHASLERQLLAAQTAKTELDTKLRERDAVVTRLQSDLRWLSEREAAEKEEKEKERAERTEERTKYENDLRTLRSQLRVLQEQHEDLKSAHDALERNTDHTIESQKAELAARARRSALLETELVEAHRVAEERAQTLAGLQAQLDDLADAQDTSMQHTSDDEDWTVVRAELHHQAEYMRTLEGANSRMSTELAALRERQASVEVLKEQKRELERKVKDAENVREKVARLEAELEAARREREEWAQENAQPSTPSKTPVSVTQSLTNLRLTYARLLEEHGSNLAQLRRRELELSDAERIAEETNSALENAEAEVRTLQTELQRAEHNAELTDREAAFLRAMVTSFTAEEATQGGVHVEEALPNRVQHLETLVADYKKTIQSLTKELRELGDEPGGAHARHELQDEVEHEKAARAEAEKAQRDAEVASEKHLEQIEELEQKLFDLGGEIGAGRHLPPGVRVLSLRDNPAQQWQDLSQAAMDRLKGENEALLKRLKELEASGARSGQSGGEELVPRESLEVANKEKTRLEDELRAKDKRLMRLQQVFSAKSTEFREAIASILGVKLAFYPNGQVRVTSQFDLNAAFVFQPTGAAGDGMKMQLIAQGDGGPEDLPQLMHYWVEKEQCIPGFLSSITLECYEKNKMERERGQ
ncbi:MAD-domain-containing protein [Sparassis crispa]|uniref:Spindle assembly checkpoint component MAD1 n=1 Tax=Sparassis crispa TaxID=139825 RepID=A0A401GTF0_9APHY|nr:MAD-domain-containing protein [Sparassis crispa]GBE85486.1 MAD-domain-containing protein [Sparassis crispa]